jgi:hypothetical protein
MCEYYIFKKYLWGLGFKGFKVYDLRIGFWEKGIDIKLGFNVKL